MKKCSLALLIGASAAWTFAIAQPLLPIEPHFVAEAPPKPLTAIISAPGEVNLGNTSGFTVQIALQSNNGKALPERIRLRTIGGYILNGDVLNEPGEAVLPVENGLAHAEIVLHGVQWRSKDTLEINVTPVDETFNFIGVAQVKIRDAFKSEVAEISKTLKADVQEKGVFKALVKDQYGDPVPDMPCFMGAELPGQNSDVEIAGRTDQNGVATFEIPPVNRAGQGSIWLLVQRAVIPQCYIEWKAKP